MKLYLVVWRKTTNFAPLSRNRCQIHINWIWTGISRYLQKILLKLISTLLEYMLLKHRNVKLLPDLQELK